MSKLLKDYDYTKFEYNELKLKNDTFIEFK